MVILTFPPILVPSVTVVCQVIRSVRRLYFRSAIRDPANNVKFQWRLSQNINTFDDVKFEAASVVAELYEQQQQPNLSKPILRKAIELSQHNVYWHCRLIFQLAVSCDPFE